MSAVRERRLTTRRDLRSRLDAPQRAGLALALIVVAAAALTALYVARVSEWLVMTDELQYVKLAVHAWNTGSPVPHLHGEYYASLSQLYPLLLAPIVGLLPMPAAFHAIHVLNAVLMALTAVPTYLLAREISLGRPLALLAAALAVFVPWMAMSTVIMTEVVAYPVFATASLLLLRAIVEPSPRRDVLALVALVVAFFARTQFILLGPVFVLALVAHELLWRGEDRDVKGRARAHVVLVAAAVVAGAAAAALILRGSFDTVLGNYGTTVNGTLLPDGLLRSAVIHLDYLVAGVAAFPFVLGLAWILGTLVRPASRAAHALGLLVLIVVPAMALQVASFDLRFVNGQVQTRYLFYVLPLVFVAFVAWCSRPRTAPVALGVSAVLFAWLVGFAALRPGFGPYFSAPETVFHDLLYGRSQQLGKVFGADLGPEDVLRWGVLLGAAVLVALTRLRDARVLTYAVPALVLAFCAVETTYVLKHMVEGSNGARRVSGNSVQGRDWVDAAVPDGASVALATGPVSAPAVPLDEAGYYLQQLWWDTEFWNSSIEDVVAPAGTNVLTPFPYSALELDQVTGAVRTSWSGEYVVTSTSDPRFALAGETVATRAPLQLVRLARPLRMTYTATGFDGFGRLGGASGTIRAFGAGEPRSFTVRTRLVPGRRARTLPVRLSAADQVRDVRVERPRWASLTTCVAPRGFADVVVSVPAWRRPGGPPLRITRIDVRPAGACGPRG